MANARAKGRPVAPLVLSAEERERLKEIRSAVHENKLGDPSRVTDEDYAWFTDHPGIWVWEEDSRILGFSAGDTRDGDDLGIVSPSCAVGGPIC